MNIQFASTVEKVQTLKDGSCKIVIETQELPPEQMATLFSLKGQMWACFAELPVKIEELNIPDYVIEKSEKSPSKKLKDRIAAFYHWKHKNLDGFNKFYDNYLDELGLKFLAKIED